MHFVITGCGRSGTGYVSRVLTQSGVACGHESVFHPTMSKMKWKTVVADASWLAVPHLRWIRGAGYPVFHQVRDPYDVLCSFLGIKFFHKSLVELNGDLYLAYIHKFDKAILSFDDPLRRAMTYWVRWNLNAEMHSCLTYKIEELDVKIIEKMCRIARTPVDLDAARKSLELISKDVNHRDRAEINQLPNDPLTEQFKSLAKRYGYSR